MSDAPSFAEFIKRIRAGDAAAAEELVRQYEPLIRREIRMRMHDDRLARAFDSMDVCQSVMASFFVRTALGQYDLERPEQLVRLLISMARHKLAAAARRQSARKRDGARHEATREQLAQVASAEASPSSIVANAELLRRLRELLSVEERQLAELRTEGASWEEIAARLGGKAQARRMQLARALERAGNSLGLDLGDL